MWTRSETTWNEVASQWSKWSRTEFGVTSTWYRGAARVISTWHRSYVEVNPKWTRSDSKLYRDEIDVNRSGIEVNSKWHRSELNVKSNWTQIDIDVISGFNQRDIEDTSKWIWSEFVANRSDLELKTKCVRRDIDVTTWVRTSKPGSNWGQVGPSELKRVQVSPSGSK